MAVNEVVVVESQSQTVVVNNTTADPVIVVENPTGVRTVDVLAGIRGVPGPVNVLTPGTITTGEPGTNVSATITGQSPNQVLNLTIPRGDVGASNVLDIGTVTTLHSGETPDVTITGTSPTQTLNISLPKGAEILSGTTAPTSGTGSQNDWYINTTNWDMYQKTSSTVWTLRLNLRGATGPANTLSVGTVSTVGSTIPAATTITGTSPNQTLNLTLPRGSQTLSGTSNPAAGTGLIGDWYINTSTWDQFEKTDSSTWTLRMNIRGLKGDKGDTGNTGPANQLSIGSVTTGAPGSTATANITGTAPVQTLSLTIPRGDVGATGPAPNLDVGTVTTGAAGSSAAATVTGTNPNYLINLTVPRGDKGEIGAQWYSGANAPTSGQYADGDYYLVTGISGTGDVYKKEAGIWNLQGNIRGLPGSGNVNSVNGILPDVNGQILLNSHIIRPAGVSDSGNGTTTGYWSRIATITLNAQYQDFALKVSINSSETGADPNQGGFVAMNVRQNDPLGTAPAVRFDTYELRDMTPADLKYTVDATATESAVTFWIKSNRPYTKFTYFMVDQSNSVGLEALDFNQGEARVAIEPVGATANGNANWHVFQKEQLPAIAINDTFVVNSEAEMLALTAQVGDTAVRNDTSTTYILKTEPATVLANWIPLVFNASNLTQGTIGDAVLPARLKSESQVISDWNLATANGFYSSNPSASSNAPNTTSYFVGIVYKKDNWLTQEAWSISGSSADTVKFRRTYDAGLGTWGAWYKLSISQAEQDARYVQLTGNQTIAGSKTFSSPIVIDRANGYTSTITDNNINFSRNGANYINLNDSLGQLLINGTTTTAGDTQILAMSATAISAYLPIAGQTPTATNHLTTKSYVDAQVATRALTTHNHDASAINAGTLDIARIPTGTTSTTVALGNHLHAGVYEPVIAAGTTAQYRRGDNTWQDINTHMVDLASNQSISGQKIFDQAIITAAGLSGDAIRIGNDAYIVDINQANSIGIQGASDRSVGTIRLGNANSAGIYGSGADLTLIGSNVYLGNRLNMSGIDPTIRFEDTDRSGAGKNYWLHNNTGTLYLLQDRVGNGEWQDPYPMWISPDGLANFGIGMAGDGSNITSLNATNIDHGKLSSDRTRMALSQNTGQSQAGYYAKMVTITFTAQYAEANFTWNILNGGSGITEAAHLARIALRIKQQDGMGSPPFVNLMLEGINSGSWTNRNIIGVLTQNDVNTKVFTLYIKISGSYDQIQMNEQARYVVGSAGIQYFDSLPLEQNLPAGTQYLASGLVEARNDTNASVEFTSAALMTSNSLAAPKLAFHKPGQYAGSISQENATTFAFLNQFGNAYNNIIAQDITASGAATINGGALALNNGGANTIFWNSAGVGAPTFNSRTAGTKLVLYPQISGNSMDYAIGIDGSTLWQAIPVPDQTNYFKWYGGTSSLMQLRGDGQLTVGSIISGNQFITGRHVVDYTTAGTSYTNSNLEVRGNNTHAPHIAFHTAGVVASQISVESDGTIVIVDNPGTGYEKFRALQVQTTATTNSVNTQRFVFTTASQARPTGTAYVEWVGPEQPANAISGDTWISTA